MRYITNLVCVQHLSVCVHLSQPCTRLCLNCVQQIPSALVQAIVKQMFGWTSKWERLPLTSDTSTLPSSGPSLNIDHLCPHLHVEVVLVCTF